MVDEKWLQEDTPGGRKARENVRKWVMIGFFSIGRKSGNIFLSQWCTERKVKVSLHSSQVAHQAGAYPSFRWDASPSQGYPQH